MTEKEAIRTLQSMKPCVVNAEARDAAIDYAVEVIDKVQRIKEIAKTWMFGIPEVAMREIADVIYPVPEKSFCKGCRKADQYTGRCDQGTAVCPVAYMMQ